MHKRYKYDYKFRLQCCELINKGNRSLRGVAKEKGIHHSNLELWMSFYKKYGKAGLRPRANRNYDVAFKLEVLAALDNDHLSLRSACVRFNIPNESVIITWQRAYKLKGPSGLISQPRGRPKQMKLPIKRKPRKSTKPLTREQKLLQENEYLKAENELLKKLQALVQTNKKQKP